MNKTSKPRIRVTWDETGVIQCPSVTNPDNQLPVPRETATPLPIEDKVHELGGQCPHCGGTGRYFHHLRRSWDKCYRCDGKGTLDAFDLALLRFRIQGAGPVSQIYGGPPRRLKMGGLIRH